MELSDWLAVFAIVVSGLSLLTAYRANARAGAAIVVGQVTDHPTVREAFYGNTRLTITNTGPAVAEKVVVIIREEPDEAEARATLRGISSRRRRHSTPVTDRLGIGSTKEVVARGITESADQITIKWRDGAGSHRIHPDPVEPVE